MQIRPFHAVHYTSLAVWHDNDDCPAGRSAGPGCRLPGTEGRPRCPYCAMLAQQPVRATRTRERARR